MINNFASRNNDEFAGDELARCKSYLQKTVIMLEDEHERAEQAEARVRELEKEVEREIQINIQKDKEIESLHHALFWNKDPYKNLKKDLLESSNPNKPDNK